MNNTKYFKRRQFVFGPEYLDFEGWRKYKILDDYLLTVHPDLAIHRCSRNDNSITLLGYIIDPEYPEKDEAGILDGMMSEIKAIDNITSYLNRMSGRFVVIVKSQGDLWLFHDAAGLRQVLYCKDNDGKIWCASQSETLSERIGFLLDKEVLEYRNSSLFNDNRTEFWLMNTRTPYKEILQLLPNHYLDLRRVESIRYWPTSNCISQISVEEGVRLSTPIIKNTIETAYGKFNLKMGISAGMDSRKTLAATKEIKEKLYYFTIEHNTNGIESVDVKVPRKLLSKLGIQHHIIGQKYMDEEFQRLYEASATFARKSKGNIAYTLLAGLGPDANILNSNTAEISQCNYWVPKSEITGEGLAIITGLYHPLAIREFDEWIKGAQDACEQSGLNILGLFHWEQRAGRWATAAFAEYDIVHESFTPYNNRLLNTILLGISERYRRNRMWYVGLRQIKKMWPEVLSEPINPASNIKDKTQRFVRYHVLHKFITPWIPIYEYCRYLRRKWRARR